MGARSVWWATYGGCVSRWATHFVMKTLPKVASEMGLSVLAYNFTRVRALVGKRPLMVAISA